MGRTQAPTQPPTLCADLHDLPGKFLTLQQQPGGMPNVEVLLEKQE